MTSRTTYWAATHSERDPKTGVDAYIPTKGNPTSASDLYRVVGYTKTGHEGWNSCYTDVHTCVSLAKLIEGEISSWKDIKSAEIALQLLMWHDRVDVLVPGFKQITNGFKSYVRCEEERSELSFELFKALEPYDQIYVTELVQNKDGVIVESNYQKSFFIGKSIDEARANYLTKTPIQVAALSSIALDFGVPAYFTNPLLESCFDKAGYFHTLYKKLNKSWNENEFIPPSIESNIHLPPLLSIVLSRSASRDSIPESILSLRAELSPVRDEILGFNKMLSGAYNQVELENECKRISQSFDATFAASRYDGSKVIFPLLKLYKTFRKPIDELINIYKPDFMPEDPRILANRTLTGKMFSNLLVTDSMHSLASHFLTKSEIRSLEIDTKNTKKP